MTIATPSRADQLSAFINATFRLNNALLSKRDNLVLDLGLTSARWQVLEAAQMGGLGSTASSVARQLGLSRQGVQRIINDLEKLGMLGSRQNPDDKRAHLIIVEEKGASALAEARSRQAGWAEAFDDWKMAGAGSEVTDLLAAIKSLPGLSMTGGVSSRLTDENAAPPQDGASTTVAAMPERVKPRATRAFEGVQAHILGQIKSGQLKSDSKLPAERELAVYLGVGRSAVREALRSLEISGVLRFERGASGGAFVRQGGPDGIATSIRAMLILGRLPLTDLLEVRASLLGQCARLGTIRATTDDLDRLERNIDALEERIATVKDQRASIVPATDFYRLAARAAHNPLMVMLVDAIADLVAEMLQSFHQWLRMDAVAVEARRQMLAAMRAGNADEAERVIRLHTHETNLLLLGYEKTLSALG